MLRQRSPIAGEPQRQVEKLSGYAITAALDARPECTPVAVGLIWRLTPAVLWRLTPGELGRRYRAPAGVAEARGIRYRHRRHPLPSAVAMLGHTAAAAAEAKDLPRHGQRSRLGRSGRTRVNHRPDPAAKS